MNEKAGKLNGHQRNKYNMAFFLGFLRHPEVVGSIIPSSRFLEKRIVEAALARKPKVLVELGPGTGGTTRALLQGLDADAKLLAIELDDDFASLLEREQDPRLIVHRGSAADLGAILEQHNLPAPDAVVSGIPFSTMPRAVGVSIIEAVWGSLAPAGCFVAYQFRNRVITLGREVIGVPEVEMELLNIPPMRVSRWRKADDNGAAGVAAAS